MLVAKNSYPFLIPSTFNCCGSEHRKCSFSFLHRARQSRLSKIVVKPNHSISLTIRNTSGNVNSCSYNIFVNDNINPVVTYPDFDAFYTTDSCKSSGVFAFEATATYNCGFANNFCSDGGSSIIFPYQFPLGSTALTVFFTHTRINKVFCSFEVVVEDIEYHVITACQGANCNFYTFDVSLAFRVRDWQRLFHCICIDSNVAGWQLSNLGANPMKQNRTLVA
jgi:hypothetical protein